MLFEHLHESALHLHERSRAGWAALRTFPVPPRPQLLNPAKAIRNKSPAEAGPQVVIALPSPHAIAAMILSVSASGKTLTVVVRTFPIEPSDSANLAMASSLAASTWMMRS